MLTTEQLSELLRNVTYKSGWTIYVYEPDSIQGPYLSIVMHQPNAIEPDKEVELRIFSQIPPMPTQGAFYEWLLWRLTKVEIHEAMEFFRVNGNCWIDPHAPM